MDRRAQVAFIRYAFDPSFDWDDAEWLVNEWGDRGPVALKGVLTPEDARLAVERGFDAVWVSNHGGRQLETSPAAIDVLPNIGDALGGVRKWAIAKDAEEAALRRGASIDAAAAATRAALDEDADDGSPPLALAKKTGLAVELVVDGGVQRGTDVLKGLALGADAVALGKPYLYGLGAGGEAGVDRAFTILRDELERAFGLLGVGTTAELRRRIGRGEGLVRRRGVSARDFPDPGAAERGLGGGIF